MDVFAHHSTKSGHTVGNGSLKGTWPLHSHVVYSLYWTNHIDSVSTDSLQSCRKVRFLSRCETLCLISCSPRPGTAAVLAFRIPRRRSRRLSLTPSHSLCFVVESGSNLPLTAQKSLRRSSHIQPDEINGSSRLPECRSALAVC